MAFIWFLRRKAFTARPGIGISTLLSLIALAPLSGFSQGSDLGFETPVVGYGSYQSNPGGAPWTFASNSGITGNGSGFTGSNPNAPEGSQAAFIRTTGSMSQPMTFAAASYTLVVSAAQRNYGSAWQTFNVTLDGVVLTNLAPAQGATTYQDYTVGPFPVTAGSHTLAFVGTDLNGGDNTILIDNLRFTQMTLSTAISPASFTTNHPFPVTITTWPATAVTYYRLNGGVWLTYTNPFTIGDGKNAATVQVDSYATDGVSFSPTNSVTYVFQPPEVVNDFFLDRIALAPPPIVYPDMVNGTTFPHPGFWTNFNVTLTGATMENNEPNHANTSPVASVWYSYATAASGEMHILVPTNSATVIAVYSGGSDTCYFPFEGSAVNALNANLNCSVNGAGATFVPDPAPIPVSAQSLNLDGTGSYLQLVDANLNSFTYSLWVKVRTVQLGAVIYRTSSAGPQSNCSESISIDSNGRWSAWGGSAITSTVAVQPNTWYHLALSGVNNGAMHFYVNGVEQGAPISNIGSISSRDRWQMGQAVAGGGQAFNGEIDDLAIYHKVLSGSQVATLATGTTPPAYAAYDVSLLSGVVSSTSGTLSFNALGNTVYQIAFAAPGNAIYNFPADFYFFPPPANDNFTNAAVIPNTLNTTNLAVGNGSVPATYINYAVQGYTEQAMAETGETENAKLSVWYSFLAPASGWLSVNAANASGIYSYLEIGQGTLSNFTNTTRSGWSVNPGITLRVIGGQQYYIRHFSDSANNWTPFTLTLVHYPQPANDLFANPAPLTLNSQSLHYVFNNGVTMDYPVLSSVMDINDFAATRESVGEPAYGNSVWYNYTPSQNGRMVVGLADYGDWGTYNGYEMGIYTGTAANSLTTQFNSQAYSWNALMNGWLTAGTNYLERIATYDSGHFLSVFEVTNTFFPNPANDNFVNRQPIVTRYVTNSMTWKGQQLFLSVDEVANVPGFNFSATTESGEALQSGTYNSIWYSWTPTHNEYVTINTVNSYQYLSPGSTIDTYLAAYTGSAVNALTTVTGNDNGPSMGNWSQIGFTPAPGTEYKIQISNYGNGSAGWTMLNFQQPFRPANDYFTNATPVTLTKAVLGDGSTFEYLLLYGTITNASVEASEPNNGGVSTVWYTWTNDITGPVTIRMDSSFGGNFYVYSGNTVTSLSTIAGPVGGLDGKIYCTFNGVAASAYRIQVRCGTGGGAFSLEFSQKANPGNYVTTNDNQTNAFQILPDSIDANNRYVGSANGSATNATLEPGETNALTALINSGAELNDNYNTNVVGSNSLWWSYTATATRKMATYNQALVACVPMRLGLGYDAFMNLVKPSNPFNENQYLVATTNGTYFTNANSATWFANRPAPGAPFRFEMDYMYVANAGAANGLPSTYNIVIMGNNGYYDPLVIRTTDLMLGAYNNGTFTPYNIVLAQNQEYYLSLECNGGGASTAYTLTLNRTNSSTIYAGIDANSYYPMGLGACGGRVHDLRVYQTSPVSHEAIEVWQGGNLIAIDDDVVINNCTAGLTYQIRTTPLSYTTDVAAGKIATESSIVNPAANAVDNNNSTYSSTGNDTGAWLMVDLGQSYPINSVEVWNRFDQPSAAYFNVIVSDTNGSNPAILTNYAINCGGGAVGWFGADAYFSWGSILNSGNAIDTSAVTNPAPTSVYQSQRYGNFTYTIPNLLTNGNYTVRLHFAECSFTSPNQRQENVFINGRQVLTNFDAFAAAGAGNKANIQSFTVTPNSSGQITIQFVSVVANAAVEGIEVIPSSDTAAAFQASQATNGLYYYPYQGSAQWPTTIPVGRSGRYVRVQQNIVGSSLGLSSLKVNSTPTVNGQVNISVSEFNLSANGNSPEAAKVLTFTNQVTTWALPNGVASSTNCVAADFQEVAYATWYGGEWNPGGVSGGSIWYNFVPPVSGSTILANSGAVGEYLALYPGPNTSGYITYGWGPLQLNLSGGTPYWLQVGLASYGLEGVSLTIVGPPPNDNWANAINVNFATNALVTSSPDGPVTNYTCTAGFVGQNYLASRDAGEYDMARQTSVGTTGRSVWWTITAPANGYITINPTKSSFITQIGLKPESLGVGGSYSGYWVVNNGKIVNAYLSAGTRYKLCVDGSSQDTGLGMGGINLDLTFVPCPPNDNWAGPTPVTLQTNVLTGTVPDGATLYTNYTGSVASHNIGGTYEGGEYPINNYSSQGAPGRSVWFSFTAPASGYLKIDPTKSSFRTQIGIKAPGQLVSSGWGSPNAYAVNSALTYYVNAGSSYMICVDGTSSDAGYGIINLDFKLDAAPGNDCWANPTPISFQTNIAMISMPNGTATNTYYTAYGIGNNLAATYEGGEYRIDNYSSQGAPGRSVWFTFTAPYTGTLTIDPTRSTFRTQIGIKAPGQVVSSGWSSPNAYAVNSILSYGVAAGNTYMVCVDGTSSDAGYGFIDLALQINAIPYNDVFPGAMLAFATNTVLETVAEFTVTNLLYTATAVSANNYALQDSGEYSLCSQYSASCLGRTIWWSFNPPIQSYATISLAGSTFDTLMAGGVFNYVNNGKSWYNDDANGLVTSAATVLVYPGQINRIVVDGKSGAISGSVGGVNLTVSLGAPANDFYANAQVLTPRSTFSAGNMTGINIRVPGSTTYASNEGENWAGNNWLSVPPNKNVWFSYTATNSGTIYLTVESAANHLIAVYSGSSFNSGWIGGSVGVQGASPNAACTFAAAAGTTYKICIDGTVPGPFVLNLKHYGTTAPLNDNFVNRLPITNGITTTGTLAGSTRESNEPSYHGGNGSVWYSFVASCTGQLEVDTLGSASDTIIAAYTTNSVPGQVNNLTYLAANNDADGKTCSRISFPVTAGKEYEIAVALNSGTLQDFVLTPRLTCSGYVEADPGTGTFLESGTVFLTTPGGGSIYYSLNGGAYQLYTNGPTLTPTNLVYVGVTNGIFTKTGGGNNWNAAFTSGETITADGFAECVATVNNQDSMFGLQATYSSASYTGIDYALYLWSSGQLQIYEAGTCKATVGYYNVGDRLRVVRAGNLVRYYRNGGLIYTSSVTSTGTLHFAASMYQQGTCTLGPCYLRNAGLANETGVVISSGDVNGNATLWAYNQAGSVNSWNYTVQAAPPVVLKGNYLTWTNLSGVYQAGTLLTKYSANNSWGNALAVSVDSSSEDCSADFVVSPGSSYNMAGLMANNTISGYGDINFAWQNANNTLYIYESGTSRGCFGPTVPGDVLRVERLGSTINYYQNGNLRYTSSVSSSGTLRAATTIYWSATQLGPASFYLPQSPAVTIVLSPYGDSTLYTSAALPTAAPTVTSSSPDAFAQPPSLASSANFRFRNFRTGAIPSADALLSYLVNSLPGLVFQVPGPVINTTNPITVVSPSGVGGTWTITFPNGSKSTGPGGGSYTFSPQGGGIYGATLYAPGYNIPSASTNLSFVVNDLGITPSGTYGAIPFYVNAWGIYPLSIYYTFAGQGTPNILYTNPIVLGNTNVTIRFMGTRPGFTPQYLTGTYAYSPNVTISPIGTFSNATTFTVSGGSALQYQVGSGPWQAYTGPFTLDGIPGGSDFLRGCAQASAGVYGPTNNSRVSFQADYPTVTPASGTVNGTYTVTAQSDTIGAAVYYAMGDAMGSMPALATVTNLYTGPISLSGSRNFLFIARKVNYLDSAPVTNAYTAQLPSPSFVTPSATFSGPTPITVRSADNYGGTFVLTSPSGAVQTMNTTNNTASFTINEGGQFTLLLQRNGWTPSSPVTQSYNFVFTDLSIGPASICLYAPTIISINWDGTNPKTPTVYYTLDGSAPTTNSTRYTGAFTLTNSAMVTALGIRAGYASTCVSNNYIYEFPVTTWPPSGTYNNALSLSLSNSQALAIYYQVSGSGWQTYTGPFSLDGTGSGNVGLSTRYDTATTCPGPTNLCSYSFKAADPLITPAGTNFNGSLTLSAADGTAGAVIFYAVGDTNGNPASASAITNLYTGPITVASTRQFIFQARKNGYQDSGQVPQTYSSSLPAPSFGTPGGTFTNATAITLNSPLNTSQSFVLNFPDGTSQTNTVTGATTSITINQTGNYQLQLFKSPWLPSPIVTNAYTFQCADLSVTPASMNFSFPMSVQAASGSNPKPMTIFYTSDGTLPTTNSALYTGALSVSNTITLRFLGTRPGYLPQYVDRQYNYAPGCTISPPTSTNSQAITVTITPVNGNSAIYFRLNGGAWTNYANPFTLDGYAAGSALMEVYTVTGPYANATNQTTYTFQVAPLAVNPTNLALSGPIAVTASTLTTNALIQYSLNNNAIDSSNLTNLYAGTIAISNRSFLVFQGFKPGYQSTAPVQRKYIEKLPPPVFLTPSATFSNQTAISVEVSRAAPGLSMILLGPDGTFTASAPIAASGRPTATFNINATGNYQVSATGTDWTSSDPASNSYSFVVQDLVTTPSQYFDTTTMAVSAASGISTPKPLFIYYTTDGSQPTTASALYTAPLAITNTTTVTWLATRSGYSPQLLTNTYTSVPPLALSPAPGAYSNAISLAMSAPAGQSIYYSMNGGGMQNYVGPIWLDGYQNGTLNLTASYAGGATNTFLYTFQADPPTVSPPSQVVTQAVTMSAVNGRTAGSTINYYEGDVGGDPVSTNSQRYQYKGPILITGSRSYLFLSTKPGYLPSALVSNTYTGKLPTPVLSSATNWFNGPAYLTVQSGLPGYGGLYTLTRPDSTTYAVNSSSPQINMNVDAGGTYTVVMSRPGWLDSDAVTWSAEFYVQDLNVTPPSGYIGVLNTPVSAGSAYWYYRPLTIYYTLDGTTPTTNSTLYASPIPISADTTITWLAARSGYHPQLQTNVFYFAPAATISPTAANYYNAQAFTLTPYLAGSAVYYSTNSTNWVQYSGPFTVDGSTLIQYYANNAGRLSPTGSLQASFMVSPLAITPGGGDIDTPITLTASTLTLGAQIAYGLGDEDGNPPGGGGILYTNPLTVAHGRSSTYWFGATKPGYRGAGGYATFRAKLPQPVSALGTNIILLAPTQDTLSSARVCTWVESPTGNRYFNFTTNVTVTFDRPGTYSYVLKRNGWRDSDPFYIRVSLPLPDNFDQRQDLVEIFAGTNFSNGAMPQIFSAVGDLTGASAEPGEWDGSYYADGVWTTNAARATSLWYRWVAAADGYATVTLQDQTSGDTNFFIYAVGQGTNVASFQRTVFTNTPQSLSVTAGSEYDIAVYQGVIPGDTAFQLNLNFYPIPSNDLFTNALPTAAEMHYTGYTHGAGSELDEPPGASTWWLLGSPGYGILEIPFDCTVDSVTLWQGDSLASAQQIPPYYWTSKDYRELLHQSCTAVFTNNYYYFLTNTGPYVLRLAGDHETFGFTPHFYQRPANDDFAQAMPLNLLSQTRYQNSMRATYSQQGSSVGATFQSGEPASPLGPATVWYQWMASANGEADVSLTQDYFFALPIWTGFGWDPGHYWDELYAPGDGVRLDVFTGTTLENLSPAVAYTPSSGVATINGNSSYPTAQLLTNDAVTLTWETPADVDYSWWIYKARFGGKVRINGNGLLSDAAVYTGVGYQNLSAQPLYGGVADAPNNWYFNAQAGETYTIALETWNPYNPPLNPAVVSIAPDNLGHFITQAGMIYYLRVSGIGRNHTVTLVAAENAQNDALTNAAPLALQVFGYENGHRALGQVNDSLFGATAESFEPADTYTVWYEFASPLNGHGQIRFQSPSSTAQVHVYSGDTNLVEQPGGHTNLVELDIRDFAATNGGTYYLQVLDTVFSTFTVNAAISENPVNDMFAAALPLNNIAGVGARTFRAYNAFASVENAEPLPPGGLGATVWWEYVPSQSGTLVISCANKAFALWQGTNLTGLTLVAAPTNGTIMAGVDAVPYQVSFADMPGHTGPEDSDFTVTAQFYPVPSNDNFGNAIDLVNHWNSAYVNGSIYTYQVSGNNYGATVEPLENPSQDNSVWYRWSAPTNMIVYVDCNLQTFIYAGSGLNNLTLLGNSHFIAAKGQTYYIALSGQPSLFTLTLMAALLPSNDLEQNLISFGQGASYRFYNLGAGKEENLSTNDYSVYWSWTAPATNLILSFDNSVSGPEWPIQHLLASPVGEFRVSLNGQPFAQNTLNPGQNWTLSVTAGTTYEIEFLSSCPLAGDIRAYSPAAAAMPVCYWSYQNYLNGFTANTWVHADGSQPSPALYQARLPAGDNYITCSLTNLSFLDSAMSNATPCQNMMVVNPKSYAYFAINQNGVTVSDSPGVIMPVTNETAATAIALTPSISTAGYTNYNFLFSTYNLGAQTEDDKPNSVWYRFSLPADGRLLIHPNWSPCTFQFIPMDPARSNQVITVNGNQTATPYVKAGNYYLVQYGGPAGCQENFVLYQTPPNDAFTNAALVSWSQSTYLNGSIYTAGISAQPNGATTEPGEPPTSGNGSLWYRVQVPVSGKLTINGQVKAYQGSALSSLLLLSSGNNLTLPAQAGQDILLQVSPGASLLSVPINLSLTLTEYPRNDAFADAIQLGTTLLSRTNVNGTNLYLYNYQVPAGFWTGTGNGYLRNWYRVTADHLLDVWVNGWNTDFTGPAVAPNYAYADFATTGPVPNDPRNTDPNGTIYVQPDPNRNARSTVYLVNPQDRAYALSQDIFPKVWGPDAYSINVPWTWTYAAMSNICGPFTSSPVGTATPAYYSQDQGAPYYVTFKNSQYSGLVDFSKSFVPGPGVSYLYGVPNNFAVSISAGDVRMSYTFVSDQTAPITLTPLFPVSSQQAAGSVDVTRQRIDFIGKAYTYLSTLEDGEPSKPGSGGGSVWWKMQMPYKGFVRMKFTGGNPLATLWRGTSLTNLTLAANNNQNGGFADTVQAVYDLDETVYLSTDRTSSDVEFTLEFTVENPGANDSPQNATPLVPSSTRVFENGTNWIYALNYTIYPISGDYTNNDLWYLLSPPATGMLVSEAEATNTTLILALSSDLNITPAGRSFVQEQDVYLSCDTNYGSALLVYTLDGTQPGSNATVYAGGPISLTNTATLTVGIYRAGRTPVFRTEIYTRVPGVQMTTSGTLSNASGPVTITLSPEAAGATVLYRLENQDWSTYTAPIQLDGMDNGNGYFYYTSIAGGQTNPLQYAYAQFKTPAPTINPLTVSGAIGPIAISVGTDRPSDAVAYYLNSPENVQVVLTNQPTILQPQAQPVAAHFYATRLGYVQSDEVIGIYSWQTNAQPNSPNP